MQKSSFLFSLIVAVVSFHLPAYAACPARLVNNTTADAGPVMDWFDCKASLDGASFSGSVGIGSPGPLVMLEVDSATNGPANGSSPQGGLVVGSRATTGGLLDLGVDATGTFYSWLQSRQANAAIYYSLVLNPAGGNIGIAKASPAYTLDVNGSVAGTSAYNNLSDARLKKNIEPIDDALAIVRKISGVRFEWRKPSERSIGKMINLPVGTPQIGFIAQQLKSVLPEAVSVADDQDHTLSAAESKVVPVLVEAMKEQQAIIAKQALEISAMRKELGSVERKLAVRTALK